MNNKMQKIFLPLLLVVLSGCPSIVPGPGPEPQPDPDQPDIIVDAEEVERYRKIFGELGRSDLTSFGNYYLALVDSIKSGQVKIKDTQYLFDLIEISTKSSDVLPREYPDFEEIMREIFDPISDDRNFTEENKERFCQQVKTVAYTLLEAGR